MTAPTSRPAAPEPRPFAIYDDPALQQDYVRRDEPPAAGGERRASAVLSLEGITCPACSWKIESGLAELPGIESASVNYSTHTAEVRWRERQLALSDILARIRSLGFEAWPFHHRRGRLRQERELRGHWLRVGCAALFGMQVMTISVGLYLGGDDMDAGLRRFLHGAALALTLPALCYAGRPFFANAWRDMKNRSLSMDAPVALGLLIAFAGSAHTLLSGTGEVYFDSICMLILFLSLSRYFEFRARLQSGARLEKLYRVKPDTATRVSAADDSARFERIAAVKLRPGDHILARAGETIPADGIVIAGDSAVDESLLTGEARPVPKTVADRLLAGSANIDSPLTVKVTAAPGHTRLSRIARLLEQAQRDKPRLTALINRCAGWFILAVLLIAAGTALFWFLHAPAAWLAVTVSVLVVTCPCALSLAAPTAYTAANNALLARGAAVLGRNALQTMAAARRVVFDKTGTLTDGELTPLPPRPLSAMPLRDCLSIAASLEAVSEHPLANAIQTCVNEASGGAIPLRKVENPRKHPGRGMSGVIDGAEYYIGNADFIARHSAASLPAVAADNDGDAEDGADDNGDDAERPITRVFLADARALHCELPFRDRVKAGAPGVIAYLRRRRIHTVLLSGDRQALARSLARRLGIDEAHGEAPPEQKLRYLADRCAPGAVTVMVGDGVNDAPALAAAHLSIAMGGGADISRLHADLILLRDDIGLIAVLHRHARRFMRVLKQNIAWAVGYNLLALPLAVSGLLTPWMAALGMSLSSLLVVVNSARLGKAA